MSNISQNKAVEKARNLFLRESNDYGCAETVYVTLKEIFRLPQPEDSSPAMALNGGIAYSGNICGAITGAALSVGELSEERLQDHKKAKTVARRIIMDLMRKFDEQYGSCKCGDLIEYDISIPEEHDEFIESGVWKDTCMDQIEFVVKELYNISNKDKWKRLVKRFSD